MQAKAAFVRSDSGVELNAEAAVYLYIAVVVHPGHAELDHAFRFDHAADDVSFFISRILFYRGNDGFENFVYSLVKFCFAGIFGNHVVIDFL